MIIDSNIIIHAMIPSEFTAKARQVLAFGNLQAPEIVIAEIANVLGRLVRTKMLDVSQAINLYAGVKKLPLHLVASRDLIDRAFELSLNLVHPIFDCYYLELALRERLPFITTDRRFIEKLRSRDYNVSIVHLSDWKP